MPGERFTGLYVAPGEPLPDSGRARHRVGALLGETVFADHGERLAAQLDRQLGVAVPGDGRYSSHWRAFLRECRTADFLDIVTVVYRYLFWHVSDATAIWWRDTVRQIFAEENLAYHIDDVGGVHPQIDREFQRNLTSAIAALQSDRYQNVRALVESVSSELAAQPPNYRQAWRAMLSAMEMLFGLMFPYARLSTDEIERRLQPVIKRAYPGDAIAQRAAQRMLTGFQEWVGASHAYRHEPGAAEPGQPPEDIAILAISTATSWLRWLAALDEQR
jgi:hypothetical protein